MKKCLLYLVLTFGLFVSFGYSASAKVKVNYDLRNHNDEFMILYELETNSPMAKFLLEHGSGHSFMDSMLNIADLSHGNYSIYSVWLRYADDFREEDKSEYYQIDIEWYDDDFNRYYRYNLIFDREMNFIRYLNGGSSNYGPSHYSSQKLDFRDHPSYYFNYYTGTVNFYEENDTFILNTITDLNGDVYYINSTTFDSVLNFFKTIFVPVTYGYGNYLNYYVNNAIIGKNIPLASLSTNLLNEIEDSPAVDSDIYNSVDVSEYPNGIIIYPIRNNLEGVSDVGFKAFSLNGNALNGQMLRFEEDGSIHKIDNLFRTEFSNTSTIHRFNFQSFSNATSLPESFTAENFMNLGYFFFASNTHDSVMLYYDKVAYNFIPVYNDSEILYNAKSDSSYTLTGLKSYKSDTIQSLKDSHYVYAGSTDYNGNNVACDAYDNCEVIDNKNLFGNLTISNMSKSDVNSIISETSSGIDLMNYFFSSIFNAFPLIPQLLKIVFISIVTIAILKMLL